MWNFFHKTAWGRSLCYRLLSTPSASRCLHQAWNLGPLLIGPPEEKFLENETDSFVLSRIWPWPVWCKGQCRSISGSLSMRFTHGGQNCLNRDHQGFTTHFISDVFEIFLQSRLIRKISDFLKNFSWATFFPDRSTLWLDYETYKHHMPEFCFLTSVRIIQGKTSGLFSLDCIYV